MFELTLTNGVDDLVLNFKLKNLNIGLIPVADIITKIDKETLLKFNKVKTVKCLK